MFTALGRLDDACPTCAASLKKRPWRKAACLHCGAAIFVRQRPLDRRRVLLRESDLPALEDQWRVQYNESQANRQPSPETIARIDQARRRGAHEDPNVEALARRVFADQCHKLAIDSTATPRDVQEALLNEINAALREQIAERLGELQTQFMFGRI